MVSCSQLHTCHEKKVAYVLRIVRVWIGGNTVRWWRRSGFQSIGYTVFGPRMILKSQTKKMWIIEQKEINIQMKNLYFCHVHWSARGYRLRGEQLWLTWSAKFLSWPATSFLGHFLQAVKRNHGKGRKIKKWIPKQMTGYLFQTHLIQQLSKPAELSFQLAIVFFQYFHSSL